MAFIVSAPIQSPLVDRNGNVTKDWTLYFQGVDSGLANTGGGGNTSVTIKSDFGLASQVNNLFQEVANLRQALNYLRSNPAFALAMQAIETQSSGNAINNITDVLDVVVQSQATISLNSQCQLAALPDSAANLDFFVGWNDIYLGSATPNSQFASSNTASEITVGPPTYATNAVMDIQYMTIVNNQNSINANLSVYMNTAGIHYPVVNNVFLQPGFTLVFDENGFRVLNAQGLTLTH